MGYTSIGEVLAGMEKGDLDEFIKEMMDRVDSPLLPDRSATANQVMMVQNRLHADSLLERVHERNRSISFQAILKHVLDRLLFIPEVPIATLPREPTVVAMDPETLYSMKSAKGLRNVKLSSPCRDCPWRKDVGPSVASGAAMFKLERTLRGDSLCHMGEQRGAQVLCEGARRFNLHDGDPLIIPHAEEFLMRRDHELVSINRMRKRAALQREEMFPASERDEDGKPMSARPHIDDVDFSSPFGRSFTRNTDPRNPLGPPISFRDRFDKSRF